jgi:hypothetical protein
MAAVLSARIALRAYWFLVLGSDAPAERLYTLNGQFRGSVGLWFWFSILTPDS